MRILITGNMGYVGPSVVRQLRRIYPKSRIEGFDSGFFAHCLTTPHDVPERRLDAQHFGDVRSFDARLLDGCDAVILLAARAAWFHCRVLHDEKRLQAEFGADYDAYRARVRRWIPFIL